MAFVTRSLSLTGIQLCFVLAMVSTPLFGREIRAQPSAEIKRQIEESKQHEEEVWRTIEPEVRAWAQKGKPYLPQAANPGDLPQASVPAFPGAEGGGKYSFGGRGGRVYVVTTLSDDGPGSFREACEAAGPRIVVFNVAGIIHLKRSLHIKAPYITVAGQTAPGDGVCIAGNVVSFDTHDVVIRYMRFRRGENNDERREHSLTGHVVGNMIVDHCSVSWSMEENLSMYRHMYTPPDGSKDLKLPSVNITIQWTISSEGLNPNNHAFGGTWGGKNTSFHHNLFANNTGRNPSIGMGYDFNFINNVLYNWRHRTVDGGDKTSLINCINNYYRPGPVTPRSSIRHCIVRPTQSWSKADPVTRFGKVYVSGNLIEDDETVSADNWAGGVQFKSSPGEGAAAVDDPKRLNELIAIVRSNTPFPMASVTIQPAKEAYAAVLEGAGAVLPRRDAVDVRVLNEVRSGVPSYVEGKGIITDISQVGGYPEYKGSPRPDLCADGIPLSWKRRYRLPVEDPALSSKDLQGDGYTVMDKYLNGLDPTRKIDWSSPASNRNTLTQETFGASLNPEISGIEAR
jgi:pectate lyase